MAIAAVVCSFVLEAGICRRHAVGLGPAIMAAWLTLGLIRRPPARDGLSTAVTFGVLPLIALGAAELGQLLHEWPVLGAAAFVAVVALSVLVRRFGQEGVVIGHVVALTSMAILIVPIDVAQTNWIVGAWFVIAAGIIASGSAIAFRTAGKAIGLIGDSGVVHGQTEKLTAYRRRVSVRMSLQVTFALTAAFVIGYVIFPQHWGWVVLTAFIVCGATRNREEALHKAVLRLAGALTGTVLAAAIQHVIPSNTAVTLAAIAMLLFIGTWLRELNYAYWAGAFTLVLALLQRFGEGFDLSLLAVRLEAIVAGALCGVAAAWFVLPIEKRRKIAAHPRQSPVLK